VLKGCAAWRIPFRRKSTRLLVLHGERVANHEFYPMLRNLGFNNLPDQSTMGAIDVLRRCGFTRTILEQLDRRAYDDLDRGVSGLWTLWRWKTKKNNITLKQPNA